MTELKVLQHESLRAHFRISGSTPFILSTTGEDERVELMWPWFSSDSFADMLRLARPVGVWTPNFSIFRDAPRTNDLHSIKRIALCARSIAEAGVAPILHVHGRQETDYLRWAKFVSLEPIDLIGFEFASVDEAKRPFHARMLAQLAHSVDRPLTLLVKAGTPYLPILRHSFDKVVVIDKRALYLARRRRAAVVVNGVLRDKPSMTLMGQSVDELFRHNLSVHASHAE